MKFLFGNDHLYFKRNWRDLKKMESKGNGGNPFLMHVFERLKFII
jgi:hypothetical protein